MDYSDKRGTNTIIHRPLHALEHPTRTAIAAVASLLAARLCRLPESYWAAITTLIVMQSTLGSALEISIQRLIGTAIGAIVGASITAIFVGNALTFGIAIFAIGLACPQFWLGKAAIRFAGITAAIVMLVGGGESHWAIAAHRFIEVSVGILVGLAITALWPESDANSSSPP